MAKGISTNWAGRVCCFAPVMLLFGVGCAAAHGGKDSQENEERWLAAEVEEGLAILRFVDPAEPREILVAEEEWGWSYDAKWSHDGSFLAFSTKASGPFQRQVSIANLEGETELVGVPVADEVDYEWIGSSTLLVATRSAESSHYELYRIQARQPASAELIAEEWGAPNAFVRYRVRVAPRSLGGGLIFVANEAHLIVGDSPLQALGVHRPAPACIGRTRCVSDLCGRLHWSPDGRYLATCSLAADLESSIHVGQIPLPPELMSPNGEPAPYEPTRPYAQVSRLSWAPEGSVVGYLLTEYSEPYSEACTRYLVFADVQTAEVKGRTAVDCGPHEDTAHVLIDSQTALYVSSKERFQVRVERVRLGEQSVLVSTHEGELLEQLLPTRAPAGAYLITTGADPFPATATFRFVHADAFLDGDGWSAKWGGEAYPEVTPAPRGSAMLLRLSTGATVMDGGVEPLLLAALGTDDYRRAHFTPDGRGILFVRSDGVFLLTGPSYVEEQQLRMGPTRVIVVPPAWGT